MKRKESLPFAPPTLSALLALCLLLFQPLPAALQAQSAVTLSNNRWIEVDACREPQGIICDNGGPTGDYQADFDGGCVIFASPGATISLYGHYDTEAAYDIITVSDGYRDTGSLLSPPLSGTDTLLLSSSTGFLSLRFRSDAATNRSGFLFRYRVSGLDSLCENIVGNLSLSMLSPTGASLSWSGTHPGRPLSLFLDDSLLVPSGNSHTFSHLAPAHLYHLALVDSAHADNPCCYSRLSFRTPCLDSLPAPFTDNFDSYTTGPHALPDCWTRLSNFDDDLNQPQITPSPSDLGGALRLYCGSNNLGTHFSMVVSPQITTPLASLLVRLRLRSPHSGVSLQLGVCEGNSLYSNNFVPVATLTTSFADIWQEFVVPLHGVQTSGRRIALRMLRSQQEADRREVWVDDLSVECCGVSRPLAFNRSSHSLWLQWDSYGVLSRTDVEIGPLGFVPHTGRRLSDVSSPLRIDSLAPATAYEFHVIPRCLACAPLQPFVSTSASTLQPDLPVAHLCESFELPSSALPYGWRAVGDLDGNGWASLQSAYAFEGLHSLALSSSPLHPQRTLLLPLFDTPSLPSLKLQFRCFSLSPAQLLVGVVESPENVTNFEVIDTVSIASTQQWLPAEVDFSHYQGTASCIALRPLEGNGAIFVDNLQLGSCLLSDVRISQVSSTGLLVQWMQPDDNHPLDSVVVLWGAPGFAVDTARRLVVPASAGLQSLPQVALQGLIPSTDYELLIYGCCGASSSPCDMNRYRVRTLSNDITLPFCEDFENEGAFPDGWFRCNTFGGYPSVTSQVVHGGSYALAFNSYGTVNDAYSMVALPYMANDDIRQSVLSFHTWAWCNSGRLQVGVMDNPDDLSSFVPVATLPVSASQWSEHLVSFSDYAGAGHHIAIRLYLEGACTGNSAVIVDDLMLSSCIVSNVRHSDINSHSVTISWDSTGTAFGGAVVELDRLGFTQGTGTFSSPVRGGSLVVDTLQRGTAYNYYVYPLCSDSVSACLSSRYSFTTLPESLVDSWCNDFDHLTAFPGGWQRPLVVAGYPQLTDDTIAGGKCITLFSSNNAPSMLLLPPLEEDSLAGLLLRVAIGGSRDYECNCRLLLGFLTDPSDPTSFEPLDSLNLTHSDKRPYLFDLGRYAGSGRHLAFLKKGSLYASVDNMALSRCFPTDVTAGDVTDRSFTLSWHRAACSDTTWVALSSDAAAANSQPLYCIPAADTVLHFDNLVPGAVYRCLLWGSADDTLSLCRAVNLTVPLLPPPVVAPVCFDFDDDNSGALPYGWFAPEDDTVVVDGSTARGSRSLRLRCHNCGALSSDDVTVVMPSVDIVNLADLYLDFWFFDDNHQGNSHLVVGVMDNPQEVNTFSPVDTFIVTPASWHHLQLVLASYVGSGRNIAFRYGVDNPCHSASAFLDDVSLDFGRITSCAASATSEHSVALSWNATDAVDSVWVEFLATQDDFEAGNGARLVLTSSPVTVTGLDAGTRYVFHFYPSVDACNYESAVAVTFFEREGLPLCEDFESAGSGAFLAGWGRFGGEDDSSIQPSTDNHTVGGSRSLRMSATSDACATLLLPRLQLDEDCPQRDSLYGFFWLRAVSGSGVLVAGYVSDADNTDTFIATGDSLLFTADGQWQRQLLPFSHANDSSMRLAVRLCATDGAGAVVSVDDFCLQSCVVTGVTLSQVGTHSVVVDWTGFGTDSVVCEYGPEGFLPGTGDSVVLMPSCDSIGNLLAGTVYDFLFSALCACGQTGRVTASDGEGVTWRLSTRTQSETLSLPWCETFDGDTASVAAVWSRTAVGNCSFPTFAPSPESGGQCLQFSAGSSSAVVALLPPVGAGQGHGVLLSLYAYADNAASIGNGARLMLALQSHPDSVASRVMFDTLTLDEPGVWQRFVVELNDDITNYPFVALVFEGAGSAVRCYVDDVSLAYCAVRDASLSVVADSLVVRWTSLHAPQSVAVEYGPHGFSPGQGTTVTATGLECRIGGLDLQTSYDVYVTPLCDGATAEGCPSRPLTFVPRRTLPFCEDFSSWGSGDNAFPSGWQRHNTWNNNRYLRVDSDNLRSALHFQCNSSGYCYAVLPEIDIDSLHRCHLYLTMSSNDCTNTALVVGLSNNPGDLSDFTPVDTLRNSVANYDNWEQFHVSFANCDDSARFIVLRQIVFGSPVTRHISVDGVFISSFPRPNVALVDWNSVRIAVDSSVHGCWLAAVPHGQIPDTLPIFCLSGDTVISDLLASTTYDIYAWSASQWSPCSTCAVTALCAPFATVSTSIPLSMPYCEDFVGCDTDETGMPSGWFRLSASAPLVVGQPGAWPRVLSNSDNVRVLRFLTDANGYAAASLPPLDDDLQEVVMTIEMKPSDYRFVSMEVGTTTEAGDMSTFRPLASLSCGSNLWQRHQVPLVLGGEQGRFLVLRMTSSDGAQLLDLRRVVLQRCPPVKASLVEYNSVKIWVDSAFMSMGNDIWLEYGPHGFAQGASNLPGAPETVTLVHVDSLPFMLNGLSPLTEYDFYVRCDSSSLSCLPPVRVATGILQYLPWCEDFDASLPPSLPQGWTSHASTATAVAVTEHEGRDASAALTLTASNSAAQPVVVLPQLLDSSGGGVTLNFRYRFEAGFENRLQLEVGWLADREDGVSFVPTDTLWATGAEWSWATVTSGAWTEGAFPALRLKNSAPNSARAYVDDIVAEPCAIGGSLQLMLLDHNSLLLCGDMAAEGPLFVEVGPEGFVQGEGLLWRCDSLPFAFEWPNDSVVECYVRCDSAVTSCRAPLRATTVGAAAELPLCLATADGELLSQGCRWLEDLLVLPPVAVDSYENLLLCVKLRGRPDGAPTVGTLRDGLDASSFVPLPSFVEVVDSGVVVSVPLSAVPDRVRFLALRGPGVGLWSDSLEHLSIMQRGLWDVSLSASEADQLSLDWRGLGNLTYEVVCVSSAGDSSLFRHVASPPLRIGGLQPLTSYSVSLRPEGLPPVCAAVLERSLLARTPGGRSVCIDPTDLSAGYVTCAVGSFSDPSRDVMRVDYGPASPRSRHTVHSDTSERDVRTEGLLRTVPPEGLASVRLGNWSSNPLAAEGESVEYELTVDTAAYDLLLLRYAAVLQDPLHADVDQPRFTLEVLDSAGNQLSRCALADFRANHRAGWHVVDSSQVLWKDWTTVGVELSPFQGRQVRIRLTTRDCNEGSHFGYAYFTLQCGSKRLETSHCGTSSSNSFTAPAGFVYSWYVDPDDVAGTTFSHERSITVHSDSSRYFYCRCAFAEDTSCHFTLSAYAGARYPLAAAVASVSVSDCRFLVSFENRSAVSADGLSPLSPMERCESAVWWFGNGDTATSYNAATSYAAPGDYEVTLISSIAGGECSDTLRLPLHLQWGDNDAALVGDSSCCAGDTLCFAAENVLNPRWSSTDTLGARSVCLAPLADTVVQCWFVNSDGCPDSLSRAVRVWQPSASVDSISLCDSQLPLQWGDTLLGLQTPSAAYAFRYTSASGCDSTATLALDVRRSTFFAASDTVLENALPLSRWGLVITADRLHRLAENGSLLAFDTSFVIVNASGCDSTVSLSLRVLCNRHSSADTSLCFNSLPLFWQGALFSVGDLPSGTTPPFTITKSDTLSSAIGADSIVTLNVHLLPSFHMADSVSVCRNELPLVWQDTSFSVNAFSDTYFRRYLSSDGCDSVHSLHLVVSDVYQMVDHVESCIPFTWIDGRTYSERTFGPQVTLTSRLGCDSIVTLDFRRKAPSVLRFADTICEGQTYEFARRSLSASGIYFDSLLTSEGCDSIVILSLTQLPTPQVSIALEADCSLRGFLISAHADVDVLQWSTDIGWNAAWGDPTGERIWIAPRLPMLLTLTADYSTSPQCPASVSLPLTPMAVPEAIIEVSPEYLSEDKDNFLAVDRSRSNNTRVWWVDDVFYGDDEQIWCHPENCPDSVVIRLVAMSEFCEDTAVRVIRCYQHNIFAPNAFTPDLTTNNRFFLAVDGLDEYELHIYNRAGLQVFESSDPTAEWDGTYRGQRCPQGTYVWILRFTTADKPRQPQTQKGSVTLIR